MNKEELISVIVPIYNVEKYLCECIESILNQTYNDLEIILVDDGSTDNSLNICKEYEKRDDRIKVIHKKNGGLSDARNTGIKYANGKYITFVDSDDFIDKDMYKMLYDDITKENADIAGCDYYVYTDKEKNKSDNCTKNKCIMTSEMALIKMNQLTGFGISACNKLYRKELFDKIIFPIGKVNEDWFVMYKILDEAQKIIYNPKAKYYYRQRNNSITKSDKINFTPIEAAEEVLKFVKKKYPKAIISAKFAYINVNIGIYNKMLQQDYNKEQKEKIIMNIKKYKKDILKIKNIKLYKKLQIICIIYNRNLYNTIMKIKNRKESRNT